MSEKLYTGNQVETASLKACRSLLDLLISGKQLNSEQLTADALHLVKDGDSTLPVDQNLQEQYKRLQERLNPSKMESLKNLVS